MVGGFNTNVRYRGHTYHIQTEDSGPAIAKIVTLLYEGGSILFSRKTSYSSEAANAQPGAVRTLMEKQHCQMVEALKAGELDAEISAAGKGHRERATGSRNAEPATPAGTPHTALPPRRDAAQAAPAAVHEGVAAVAETGTPHGARVAAQASGRGANVARSAGELREFGQGIITPKPLDELILAQLAAK
jgi:hypothetical protein